MAPTPCLLTVCETVCHQQQWLMPGERGQAECPPQLKPLH